MQITIGDALTVVGVIFGVLVSVWALLVGFAILFPAKAQRARVEVELRPWRSVLFGVLHNTVVLVLAAVFTAVPNPLFKLIGWFFYVALFSVMIVGGSGIALMAGARIQRMEHRRGNYRALERGALLLVVGSLLPFFGWFAFAPAVMTVAGGAGIQALFGQKRSMEPVRAGGEMPGSSGQANQEFVV